MSEEQAWVILNNVVNALFLKGVSVDDARNALTALEVLKPQQKVNNPSMEIIKK